jgi:FkbM family methyltransferase
MTTNEEQPFDHYPIQQRIVSWISQHLFDKITYTVRHGLLLGMKRKGGLGWLPVWLSRGAENEETHFWRTLDLRGLVVYDIGAFQGMLALFFALQAERVICYEPNAKNNQRLLENIRVNGLKNVLVRKLGLGSRPEVATMVQAPLMRGAASIDAGLKEQLQSAKGYTVEQIEITTLDKDIADASLPVPGFVKIDVEGLEIEVLRGARQTLSQHRPTLFIEMHGATLTEKKRKVAEIVEWLEEIGYRNILHVESRAAISSANSSVAAEGHLYCKMA